MLVVEVPVWNIDEGPLLQLRTLLGVVLRGSDTLLAKGSLGWKYRQNVSRIPYRDS